MPLRRFRTEEGQCRQCLAIAGSVRSACGVDVRTPHCLPGAGGRPLGHYGPSAVYRSSPTPRASPRRCTQRGLAWSVSALAVWIGECLSCGPKPLRFLMSGPAKAGPVRHCAEHPHPLPLHAGGMPGGKHTLLIFLRCPCRRDTSLTFRSAASSPAHGRGEGCVRSVIPPVRWGG